jgi:hypothetical protein
MRLSTFSVLETPQVIPQPAARAESNPGMRAERNGQAFIDFLRWGRGPNLRTDSAALPVVGEDPRGVLSRAQTAWCEEVEKPDSPGPVVFSRRQIALSHSDTSAPPPTADELQTAKLRIAMSWGSKIISSSADN